MAREIADQQQFNARCNEAAVAGKAAYADFDQALTALQAMAPSVDPTTGRPVLPRQFIEAALETGKGADLIYNLGKNPAEADRIMSLPPLKQAVELARMADKLAPRPAPGAAPAPSEAPAPITPVVGTGGRTGHTPAPDDPKSDELDMASWIKARNKQLADKRRGAAA